MRSTFLRHRQVAFEVVAYPQAGELPENSVSYPPHAASIDRFNEDGGRSEVVERFHAHPERLNAAKCPLQLRRSLIKVVGREARVCYVEVRWPPFEAGVIVVAKILDFLPQRLWRADTDGCFV